MELLLAFALLLLHFHIVFFLEKEADVLSFITHSFVALL